MLTTAKLEIQVEAWASLWIITLLLSLPCIRSALMSESQCAGQTLSITCGGPDFIIHVLYESYSYSPQDTASSCNKIATDTQCSNAEFLNPLSVGHCNGHSMCSFEVPGDKHISSCDKNNTAVKVYYSCISRNQVFDICSNFIFTNNQQLYLVTPKFPNNILQQNQCSCTVIGQNINATVLQHIKESGSKVIMTMTTDKGTMHINGINVLNTILFTQVKKIELSLVNGFPNQIFKLWIGLTGTGMSLQCGTDGPPQWSSHREIKPTPVLSSTVQLATEPDQMSAITTSDWITQSAAHIHQDSVTSQSVVVMPSYRTDIMHSNMQSLLSKISHHPSSCPLDISVSGAPCVHNDLQTISSTSQHTSSTNFMKSFSSKQEATDLISDIQMSPLLPHQLSSDDNIQVTEINKNSFESDKESLSSNGHEISNSISVLDQTESYTMPTASKWEITLSSLSLQSSSILPDDKRNSTQEKPPDSETSSETVVIVVLSCLAVIVFLFLVITAVYFYWRKNNGKRYQMQNEEIYDAYNDNPALEPNPELIVAGPRPLNGQPAGNLLLFLIYVLL